MAYYVLFIATLGEVRPSSSVFVVHLDVSANVAQWSKHLVLKQEVVSSIPGEDITSIFNHHIPRLKSR